jgi:hypothetical protein
MSRPDRRWFCPCPDDAFRSACLVTGLPTPAITGVGLAATVGAGATAQLGAMRSNEKIIESRCPN